MTKDRLLLVWIVRYVGWLYTSCQCREDGRTPHQALRGIPYSSAVCEFSECVEMKMSDKEIAEAKMEGQFITWIWVGRSARTNEHIGLTSLGVCQSRMIKLRDEDRRWELEIINWRQGIALVLDRSKTRKSHGRAAEGSQGHSSLGSLLTTTGDLRAACVLGGKRQNSRLQSL